MKNYFEFLNKKLSVDLKSGLTVDERQLLEFLAMNASNGMPLCVAGAMSLSALASPATLHRRLDDLKVSRLTCVDLLALGPLGYFFFRHSLCTMTSAQRWKPVSSAMRT